MTTIKLSITPGVISPEDLHAILKDSQLLIGEALNNYKYFDRSASDLLEEANLEHLFTVDNTFDDTGCYIAMTIRYPSPSISEVEERLERLFGDDYELESIDPESSTENKSDTVEVAASQTRPDSKTGVSLDDRKFFKQSLYIAAIDRFFGLSGLICTVATEPNGEFSFKFDHQASGETILVFPRLNATVFKITNAIKKPCRVMIDCENIPLNFGQCESCESEYFLERGCSKML